MPTLRRYDGLDMVRAGAMLLGVCYHAAYPYIPGIGRWYFVEDVASSAAFVGVVGVLHAFRMQLFFALAGFFAHLVFERRGPRGFLTDRSRRLLAPFFVALPFAVIAEVAIRRWALAMGRMPPDFEAQGAFRVLPMHLWFLEYLFLFCLAAWGLGRLGVDVRRAPGWLSRAVARPLTLLLLAVPLGVGLVWGPELRPAASFVPQPHAALHYGLFFALGWLLWPLRESLGALQRRGALLATAGLGLALVVFTWRLQWMPLGRFLAGAVPVLATLGGFGLALRVRSAARPALRFLVESSYWVYLAHYPVVLALQVALASQPWPAWAKYLTVVGGAFGVAFLTFRLFVYRTALGPWLGVKQPPPDEISEPVPALR